MTIYRSLHKYIGVVFLLSTLTVCLSGCFTNLQEIFGTPTPSPTPNPNTVIDPEIDLDPVGGYAGTLVKVSGEGWMPGKLVILKLEDEEGRSGILAANIPDADGHFQANFNYPSSSRWLNPGFNTVLAYALNEDLETRAQFVVIVPTATSTSASELATVTATAMHTATSRATATPTITPSSTPSATRRATATSTDIPAATPEPALATDTASPVPTAVDATETSVIGQSPTATLTPFAFLLLSTATPTNSTALIPTGTTVVVVPTATETPVAISVTVSTPTLPLATSVTTPTQPERDTTIISAEQVTSPITVDELTPVIDAIPTVIVVTIASAGTPPAIAGLGGTATVELAPFPTSENPNPTSALPTVTPTWTPIPQIVVIEDWRGDYWANPNLLGSPTVIRNDRTIDFDWGSRSPTDGVPNDGFSVRWTRTILLDAGIYTFAIEIDDGARLYVDGQLIIDSWETGGRRTLTAQKILSQGQHQLIFEYFEDQGNAVARLGWEGRAAFQGWRGEYFANMSLTGRAVLVQDDAEINFEWGVESPVPTLPADGFSVRWRRRVNFRAATYRFRASADDGVRVWIDDLLIIDEWRDQSEQEFIVELNLTEGEHEILVEYYENTLGAIIKFDWEELVVPTLGYTPTWTPALTPTIEPTPTWTPELIQPTPTWTPAN